MVDPPALGEAFARSDDAQVGGKPARERTLRVAGRRNVARLLDASLIVFGERGFHAARVDDICRQAEISHGTFYLYFASKDDVFASLVDEVVRTMDELASTLPPVEVGARGLDALRSWLADFYDLYAHFFPVIQAWNEANASDADLARMGARVLRSFIDKLVERVEEHAIVRVENPRVASLAMVSMIDRSITFALSGLVRVDRDDLLDNLARILHVGLFGGRQTRR